MESIFCLSSKEGCLLLILLNSKFKKQLKSASYSFHSLRVFSTGCDVDFLSTSKHVVFEWKRATNRNEALLLIYSSSIPAQTRNLIRYSLMIKDPYLAQVVRRVESGEMTIDFLHRE